MKNGISRIRKGGVGVLAALLAVVGLVPLLASPASAAANATVRRFPGTNRFDTARLISAHIGATPTVVLARGDLYPDALAGAYVAGLNNAAILLTRSDSLPAETDAALRAANATKVIIMGGTTAVSSAVETALRSRGLTVERLQGATRFETAVAAANAGGTNGTTIGALDGLRTAIIASGVNFPDAISASPMSFAARFPILLTTPTALSPQTKQALISLGIKQVLLMGGPAAVSETVENELKTGTLGLAVTRIQGANRSATSVEATNFAIRKLGFTNRRVGLARGDDFADALTYGALAGRTRGTVAPGPAAAALDNGPNGIVLSTSFNVLGDEALNFARSLQPTGTEVEIPGGLLAITQEVENLFMQAIRTGSNAQISLTSTNVAPGGSISGTISGDNVGAVTVSGCGLAAGTPVRTGAGTFTVGPVQTTPTAAGSPCTLTFTVNQTNGQPPLTITQQVNVGNAAPNSGTISVTPNSSLNRTNSTIGTGTATDTQGAAVFTATGLSAAEYDIVLVPCDNVAANGSFVNANANTLADAASQGGVGIAAVDTAATPAFISAINGVGVAPGSVPNNDYGNNVAPQGGTITFTVDNNSNQATCVRPVIFQDANNNNSLDINPATGVPTETFGLAGPLNYVPQRAGGGQIGTTGPVASQSTIPGGRAEVATTDKTADVFSACNITGENGVVPPNSPFDVRSGGATACLSYTYDANDNFFIADGAGGLLQPTTMATFESRISPFDDVTGTYASDPAAPSTYNLFDEAPTAPVIVSVVPSSTNGNTTLLIRWNDSTTPTVDAYNIYLQVDPTPLDPCPALTALNDRPTGYNRVGTVADRSGTVATDAQYEFQASGLTPGATYCVLVLSVDDGDESINNGAVPGGFGVPFRATTGTTVAGAVGGAPFLTDARAQDAGTVGILDAGDIIQLIANEPLAPSSDDPGATWRVRDSDATPTTVDIICGPAAGAPPAPPGAGAANAFCELQPAGNYNGTAYLANQVLRIRINGTPGGGTNTVGNFGLFQQGTTPGAQYPLTITNVNTFVRDLDEGNVLSLATGDTTIEGSSAPNFITPTTADAIAPTTTAATATGSGNTVTVTFAEPVVCTELDPTQFTINQGGPITAIDCGGAGPGTVVLTTTTALTPTAGTTVTYTAGANPANWVYDQAFNALANGTTAGFTPGGVAATPAPTTSGIAPTSGPTAGGTSVTITGTNLAGATAVNFCGTAVTPTSTGATTVTATSPAKTAGACAVTVTTPGGTSNAQNFTYVPPPTVTTASPNAGPTAGGQTTTISGTGFQNGATASFCGGPAQPTTFVNATTLTATTPPNAAGGCTIAVTNPDGQSATSPANTYTYVAAPVYTAATQASTTSANVFFNEPVCRRTGAGNVFNAADWTVTGSSSGAHTVTSDTIPLCNGTASNGVTFAVVNFTGATTPGETVSVLLTGTGAPKLQDQAGTSPGSAVRSYSAA